MARQKNSSTKEPPVSNPPAIPATVLMIGGISRRLGIGHMAVNHLVSIGKLKPIATTPDGFRIFDPVAVEALAKEREQRKAK